MTTTTVPEYEYLADTPTTGGWPTFLACLANEVDYLQGERDPAPHHFAVGIDHWSAGTVRYLVDVDG